MTDKKVYGFIYCIENKINGKKYIGATTKLKEFKYYWGSGVLIKKSVKEFGTKNFIKRILYNCFSKDELIKMESIFIKRFDTLNPNGYNIQSSVYELNQFQGNKNNGARRKGKTLEQIYGKEKATEWKNNIKNSTQGKLNGNYGKTWNKKQRKYLSKVRKEKELAKGENNPRYKKIDINFLIDLYFKNLPYNEMCVKYNELYGENYLERRKIMREFKKLNFPMSPLNEKLNFINNNDKRDFYVYQ